MLGSVGWLGIAGWGTGSRRFSGEEAEDTAAERLRVFSHMGTRALGRGSYEECR